MAEHINYELFNCVKSNNFTVSRIDYNEDVAVSPQEVFDGVMMLKDNKARVMDKISAEHLKFASRNLCPLLAICFAGFLIRGVLPGSILSVVLVPILKDRAGKINSSENYRPMALASILSKILERTLLNRFVGAIL